MSQPDIKAEKINSPIQLMAAWFVMLILLSGVLLAVATQIKKPEWAAGYLVITTTILIFVVIVAVILMLTKFRPHLQEGREYAEWLKDKDSYTSGIIRKKPENDYSEIIQRKIEKIKHTVQNKEKENFIKGIENSLLYNVNISNIEGAEKIIIAMADFGIEAKINTWPNSKGIAPNEHEAIWLGSKIPASVAIPIIKKSFNIWPHLKYVAFTQNDAPESASWGIYIGGATSTAIERKYKPWSINEINELDIKNTESFRKYIHEKSP